MTARGLLMVSIAVRSAYAAGSLLAPDMLTKSVGLPPLRDDERYFNGLFGGRDITVVIALVGLLRAGRDREAVLINASCEATDLAALLLEIRRRGGLDRTTSAGVGFSAAGWLGALGQMRALRSGV